MDLYDRRPVLAAAPKAPFHVDPKHVRPGVKVEVGGHKVTVDSVSQTQHGPIIHFQVHLEGESEGESKWAYVHDITKILK